MATNYLPELHHAIISRNGAKTAVAKSLAHDNRTIIKAKQAYGMPLDPEYNEVANTYYLLQPKTESRSLNC